MKGSSISLNEDQKLIKRQCEQLTETLLSKNRDYCSSIWKTPVLRPSMSIEDAILVRISDKIERLRNLLDGKEPENESLRDTFLDLAGYCILYVAKPSNYGSLNDSMDGE